MWWVALAGAVQGAIGSKANRAAVDASNRLRQLNVDSRARVRMAANAAEAGQNNLARWVQSVNNNRRLKAGGEALEANTVNARRGMDAGTRQGFSQDITAAEQAGARAASAAFSGVGGDVVDMVDLSVNLRNSIVDQAFAAQQGQAAYDTTRRAGSIMSQMVGGLDNSVIIDSLDYTQEAAQIDAKVSVLASAIMGAGKAMGMGSAMGSSDGTPQKDTSPRYGLETDTQGVDYLGTYGYSEKADHGAKFEFGNQGDDDPYGMWGGDTSTFSGFSSQ